MSRTKRGKRVVVVADFHCGHEVGLTPPDWQGTGGKQAEKALVRSYLWKTYAAELEKLKPIDLLIVNADCIDGRGARSGGTELIVVDRHEQAAMAAECIKQAEAPVVVMTYGTPYHTGDIEDFENSVADKLLTRTYRPDVEIKSHAFVDVNGLIFDIKHKVGGSQIPHGRATAILKESMWNAMWAERDVNPRSDVIIRSHVHYMTAATDGRVWAITTPALQGLGSKFGTRQCSGTVDWGFLYFDVGNKDDFTFNMVLPKAVNEMQKVEVKAI